MLLSTSRVIGSKMANSRSISSASVGSCCRVYVTGALVDGFCISLNEWHVSECLIVADSTAAAGKFFIC